MSGSRKKVPIIGMTTAQSDKRFKRAEHSRERGAVKIALAHGDDVPHPREFGNPWKGRTESNIAPTARNF